MRPVARRAAAVENTAPESRGPGQRDEVDTVARAGSGHREAMLEIRRFAHTLDHYTGMAKSIRGGYVPLLNERSYGVIIKKPSNPLI